MKLPALPRASIGVQLILLVLACLLAMHLALFAIVGLVERIVLPWRRYVTAST